MSNLNIPEYRAKRDDNGEEVIGFYLPTMLWYDSFLAEPSHTILVGTPHDILNSQNGYYYEQYFVDPSTLAIHFPDMLDSQGNKIFASLSENGKGGDVITYDEDIRIIAIYKNGTFIFKDSMNLAIVPSSRYLRTKVIGIQK